jgi:hypothetical protein
MNNAPSIANIVLRVRIDMIVVGRGSPRLFNVPSKLYSTQPQNLFSDASETAPGTS